MKDNSEMTKEELIALGWVKNPLDKMQEKTEKKLTAVEYIREKLLGDQYWYEDMTFDQIIDKAKEMEKEQKIEFAKMHVKTALKAVENEMILHASSVKHWYLPQNIK